MSMTSETPDWDVQKPGFREFAETLVTRRSIRQFRDIPLPPGLIDTLLELATAAPSAHNCQPWRFRVVTDTHEKTRLADAMAARLREERRSDGDAPDAIEGDVARSRARIGGAPALVVVCLSMADMDRYPDVRRNQAEFLLAAQSVAMAGQNLLLAAHAVGLGACWHCAPLFCPEIVIRALELPADWQPQGAVTLGYPATIGRPRPRRPLDELRLPRDEGARRARAER